MILRFYRVNVSMLIKVLTVPLIQFADICNFVLNIFAVVVAIYCTFIMNLLDKYKRVESINDVYLFINEHIL